MPGKGENIYKRKDGRWEARYIKSHDISGRAKYGYVYGKSYREAKQKQHNALAKLEDSLDTGNSQVVLYKSDIKALSVYFDLFSLKQGRTTFWSAGFLQIFRSD